MNLAPKCPGAVGIVIFVPELASRQLGSQSERKLEHSHGNLILDVPQCGKRR